jgi:orotate phosphoribosyltransferase
MAKVVIDEKIDIVLGAAIGGILIAGGVGRHLDKKHIFSERINGKMELRRGFSINEGDKVLIVEDIITTGGSVFELIKLVERFKGEVTCIVNLVDRSPNGIDFHYSSTALLNLPSKSWELNDCPLCKKNVPIMERGRTGKKVEMT